MTEFNLFKAPVLFAAAFGLALGLGLGAVPAQAHHCKGNHDFPGCVPDGGGGGAGGGDSGKAATIVWTITGGPSSLVDDGVTGFGESYFHKDGGVRTRVGGETQPHRPGR